MLEKKILETYKTTAEVPVPEKLVEQVIGQENGVDIIKKAASQRRNVLLIGTPGTGKSMLAQAMAELMPAEALEDILTYPNRLNENNPKIRIVKTYPKRAGIVIEEGIGQGRKIVEGERARNRIGGEGDSSSMLPLVFLGVAVIILLALAASGWASGENKWILAATILGLFLFGGAWMLSNKLGGRMMPMQGAEPKLIVDNTGRKNAPFMDGTGSKAGALFGDVKHDPLQSGGLGTPAHLRVEAGAVHAANKGVLFVDEVSSLGPKSQQDLLTAMQEKKFSITGQSELSSGAIVRTEPVPCDFVLVAAGNAVDLRNMHPALRSRIRGYGYELYLEDTMTDNEENQLKLVQFVAQEVKKDGKIPHFEREAVEEIVREARKRSGRKNRLTLKLRELGGLVRAAGDIAKGEKAKFTTKEHVMRSKRSARTLEQQVAEHVIEMRRDYRVFVNEGFGIGRVNGLAVLGEDASSGLIMPIVAEVTPASSKSEGKLIATGKLGEIAKEAVENVSAIIKKHIGKDVSQYDIHVQFLQTYEGVEGDSASISIALSVISAMEGIGVDQSVAMTGSLSVRGKVLPVGGVTSKVEAAIEAGMKRVMVPEANAGDVYLDAEGKEKIKVIPVTNIIEVLEEALEEGPKKKKLISDMRGIVN
ncbi:MAG: ATP-dependent protease LonB [Candidatus Micrarchaeota archaeon]